MEFNATYSYIVVVSFIVGGNRISRRKHRSPQVTDKTLSHNGASSTPRHERDSTHNVSGDRH